MDFILKRNQELNLLSRKLSVNDILVDHFEDCLIPYKYFEKYERVADLGTGGGFPGILLSIIFPKKTFFLYDKSVRKTEYLKEAVKFLDLNNVSVMNTTIQEVKIDSNVITCRAFKSIPEIIDFTKDYFNNYGDYLLYKAKLENINMDILELNKIFSVKTEIIKLDNRTQKERHLVKISKK